MKKKRGFVFQRPHKGWEKGIILKRKLLPLGKRRGGDTNRRMEKRRQKCPWSLW